MLWMSIRQDQNPMNHRQPMTAPIHPGIATSEAAPLCGSTHPLHQLVRHSVAAAAATVAQTVADGAAVPGRRGYGCSSARPPSCRRRRLRRRSRSCLPVCPPSAKHTPAKDEGSSRLNTIPQPKAHPDTTNPRPKNVWAVTRPMPLLVFPDALHQTHRSPARYSELRHASLAARLAARPASGSTARPSSWRADSRNGEPGPSAFGGTGMGGNEH